MIKTVNPITPDDLKDVHIERIEPEMREAANRLIKQHYKSGSSSFKRRELLALYMEIKGITNDDDIKAENTRIFANFLMDIEGLYRSVGWKVEYISPSWGESFDEYFKFTIK